MGGIIGATVGAPGGWGGGQRRLGLGAGALIGDQFQGQETKQADQRRQVDTNQAEIEKYRRQGEFLAFLTS